VLILILGYLPHYDFINDLATTNPIIAAVPKEPVSISDASKESAC
jgi:hypothetical protein